MNKMKNMFMKPIDYIKALGVSIAAIAITVIISFPMVAFYAYFIEPGHEQEFYNDAAQWIAPWSSYILGPIVFFLFNFWLSKHSPGRNALAFAMTTIILYVIVESFMLYSMEVDIRDVLFNSKGIFWLSIKLIGALLGAYLGNGYFGLMVPVISVIWCHSETGAICQ